MRFCNDCLRIVWYNIYVRKRGNDMEILSAGIVKEMIFDSKEERESFKKSLPKESIILGEGDLKRVDDTQYHPFLLVELPYKDYKICWDIQEMDG